MVSIDLILATNLVRQPQLNNLVKAHLQSTTPASKPSHDPKWWHYCIAGEIAGMIGASLCHPFDTTKTKMQMLTSQRANNKTISVMYNIAAHDGIHALYRGLMYPFFGFGVLNAVSFGAHGVCRNYFIRRNDSNALSTSQLLMSGMCAGTAISFVRSPMDRVKIWSQTYGKSTTRSTVELVSKYGVTHGLCFGLRSTMTREVAYHIFYFFIYESCCNLLSPLSHGDKSKMESWKIFVSGGLSGMSCWLLVLPIDVVKTRIQAAPPNTYKSGMDCALQLYRSGGGRLFYNGLIPTMYRAAVLHSTKFLVFERALHFVQDHV